MKRWGQEHVGDHRILRINASLGPLSAIRLVFSMKYDCLQRRAPAGSPKTDVLKRRHETDHE
jgi:hypothetical protein